MTGAGTAGSVIASGISRAEAALWLELPQVGARVDQQETNPGAELVRLQRRVGRVLGRASSGTPKPELGVGF